MATCKVKSQTVISGTGASKVSQYKVVFEADDGYQEEQVYVCTEAQLEEATEHFNEQRANMIAANPIEEEEERVITVEATKKVSDIFKAKATEVTAS